MDLQQITSNKLLAVCPKTGRQMTANYFTFEPISEDTEALVIWWRCSACKRWHVSEISPESSRK